MRIKKTLYNKLWIYPLWTIVWLLLQTPEGIDNNGSIYTSYDALFK